MMNLDAKDRLILHELDKNARQPASKIAKKVNLSSDGINYRIKQLVKKKAIFKFMTFLDTAKLGLTTYKVFYRFQNTSLEKENEIINYLAKHKNTQLVTTCQGMFDININVLAANAEELNKVLSEFNLKYGRYFAERFVNILVESNFFFRDYLINKRSMELRKPMFFGSSPESIEIDEYNKKIITILAENARTPCTAIARKISLSSDAVIQRIKRLEKSGIIQNYVVFTNSEQIGYCWYYFLLKFRDITLQEEERFFNYCKEQRNIWFYSKMIGSWDVVINPEVENDEELKFILTEIKKDFSKILKEYNIVKITKIYKFNQYPMGRI